MPINLRYGQQAVARGFITSQRLQQVLAKQRQLAEQGKKVSVRMILEKAKLLDKDQLTQIDRDLNIKVVKKHTGKVQKPGVPEAQQPGPTNAANFAGEAPPQFAGMEGANPDATVFSPPPPDMQDKIREERDRAKEEAKRKQEQEAAAFFNDDAGSPFGDDPFGGGGMSPEPMGGGEMSPEPMGGGEMQPEPMGGGDLQPDQGFGDDPFGGEMSPEPMGGEMQPEPMGGGDPFGGGDLQPDEGGFDDASSPFGDDPFADQGMAPAAHGGNEPAELDRLDSSPKLSSLPAEMEGFASPEDEELPTIGADFDAGAPQQPQQEQQWGQPEQQPAGPDLAPDTGDNFADFGNDIRSPEELESSPTGPKGGTSPLGAGGDNMDATMFSPPPPGTPGGRQKTGAMDRTVFSPRPPEMGGPPQQAPMEAEPQDDNWGEEALPTEEPFAGQGAGDDMDATVFSPPPPGTPGTGRHEQQPAGRQGADDFGDVELPTGKQIDDVPTAPASMDDEVHPIRRGVGTSSASVPPEGKPGDDVSDELPDDDIADEVPDQPGAGRPKLPQKGGLPGKKPKGRKELPQKQVPASETADEKKKKKGASKRVLLFFVILLLIVLAILVLPVALYDQVPQVRQLRDHPQAKPIYDYVERVYQSIPGVAPAKDGGAGEGIGPINAPEDTDNGESGAGDEAGETGDED